MCLAGDCVHRFLVHNERPNLLGGIEYAVRGDAGKESCSPLQLQRILTDRLIISSFPIPAVKNVSRVSLHNHPSAASLSKHLG